jgi:hypothetical protein
MIVLCERVTNAVAGHLVVKEDGAMIISFFF